MGGDEPQVLWGSGPPHDVLGQRGATLGPGPRHHRQEEEADGQQAAKDEEQHHRRRDEHRHPRAEPGHGLHGGVEARSAMSNNE